jgi:hypothetical protein
MAELHPSPDELSWYVTDGLSIALRGWPSDRVARVEEHVAGCAACADRLASEAALEVALGQVADADAARPEAKALPALAWLGGAAAAAVFAVALALGGPGEDNATGAAHAPPAVSVDAGAVELALDSAPDERR